MMHIDYIHRGLGNATIASNMVRLNNFLVGFDISVT